MPLLIVHSRPVPGREDEYNDWYSHTHLRDILAIPGVVDAKRYKLGPDQRAGQQEYPWEYIAIYEIEGDVPEFFANLDAAVGNGMVISTAMEDRMAHIFEPV